MTERTIASVVTVGDAFRVTLRNVVLCHFHVERIAFGSALIRVEPWDGNAEQVRIWPKDEVVVSSGLKTLATLRFTTMMDDGRVHLVCDCPADRFRVRMLGLKLGKSRVRREADPDRVIPVPDLVR